MRDNTYFVTGTDTGVGKTVVATLLALGTGSHYWKPVQTGREKDSDFARRWLGENRIWPEAHHLLRPEAPALASSQGAPLRETNIPPGPLVIEGVGGLLVPLTKNFLLLDWLAQHRWPTVVVARTSLGTINHSLLTLQALRLRGVPVKGVIFSGKPNQRVTGLIGELGKVHILGTVPTCRRFSRAWFTRSFRQLQWENKKCR